MAASQLRLDLQRHWQGVTRAAKNMHSAPIASTKGALVPCRAPQRVHASPPLVPQAQHCPQRPNWLLVKQPALLPHPSDQPGSLRPAKQGCGVREGSTQVAQVAGHELCLQQHQRMAEVDCLQAGVCWPIRMALQGGGRTGVSPAAVYSHPEH